MNQRERTGCNWKKRGRKGVEPICTNTTRTQFDVVCVWSTKWESKRIFAIKSRCFDYLCWDWKSSATTLTRAGSANEHPLHLATPWRYQLTPASPLCTLWQIHNKLLLTGSASILVKVKILSNLSPFQNSTYPIAISSSIHLPVNCEIRLRDSVYQ